MSTWIGVDPVALIVLPLALVLLALPPHRVWTSVVAVAALGFVLVGLPHQSIWLLDRGWSLVLGAWFVLAVVFMPRAAFTSRALAATAAAAATLVVLLAFHPGALSGVDGLVGNDIRTSMARVAAIWKAAGPRVPAGMVEMAYRLGNWVAFLAPSEVALASLAALGVVWGLYRRMTDPARPPFAPLREFRFRDELVWILIVGILLLVVPGLGHGAPRAGSNMVLFMSALYALRGLAVMTFLGSAGLGLGSMLFLLVALFFAAPLLVGATVVVGLTDTWLDLRARASASGSPGK